MSSEQVKDVLKNVSVDKVDAILCKRQEKIAAGASEIPKYDYETNVTMHTLHPGVQNVVVTEIIEQEGAKTFRLEPDTGAGTKRLAPFTAGQYVCILLRLEGSVFTRPYAISSSPVDAYADKPFYTITVKGVKDGFASQHILKNWKVGEKVTITEPDGTFYHEPLRDAGKVIGLAGGSGITPFYSMAQAIRDGKEDFDLTLIYGCRSEKEILFRDELDKIAKECSKFNVVYVLSDETKDGYESGFITADLIKKYSEGSEDYSLFICGPKAMYDFVRKETEKLGLPRRRVRYEAPGEYKNPENDADFPKDAVGKTYNITVDTPDGRKIIPARSGESVLVALERAGIAAKSHCRSGECGYCRVRVKSGEYYAPKSYDHRKGADVKNNYIHACSAFPVSDLHILLNYDQGEVVRKVKDMKKKERMVGLIMAVILSAVMGILFVALARHNSLAQNPNAQLPPAPVQFITGVLESITVGIIVVLVIPIGKMGRGLAAKAGAFPPSFKFTLLNSIPYAVINAIIVGGICSFLGVATSYGKIMDPNKPPLFIMWIGNYLKTLPIAIVVSYILAVIISPMVVQAVGLGGPPTDGDMPRE